RATLPPVRPIWADPRQTSRAGRLGHYGIVRSHLALHGKRDQFRAPLRGKNPAAIGKGGKTGFRVDGRSDAVNPEGIGTKAAAHHALTVPAGESQRVTIRLQRAGDRAPASENLGPNFEHVLELRRQEADEFYTALTPAGISADS